MAGLQVLGSGYAGSFSVPRNMPSSSKRSAGKVKGNKTAPRTYTVALTGVTDGEGNALSIGRRRRNYLRSAPTVKVSESKLTQTNATPGRDKTILATLPSITEGTY